MLKNFLNNLFFKHTYFQSLKLNKKLCEYLSQPKLHSLKKFTFVKIIIIQCFYDQILDYKLNKYFLHNLKKFHSKKLSALIYRMLTQIIFSYYENFTVKLLLKNTSQ